jgi:hypothetical protein
VYIVGVGVLLFAPAASIAGLIVQRANRRRAEAKLQASQPSYAPASIGVAKSAGASSLRRRRSGPGSAANPTTTSASRWPWSGKSTRQISAELALSIKTVSTYRTRLLDKMHMKTAAELAAYAVRHSLAD